MFTSRWSVRRALPLLGLVFAVAAVPAAAQQKIKSTPSPDPREGLKAGKFDAGIAIWNMKMLSNTPSPGPFALNTNSDLAFSGTTAFQGNYDGVTMWDIANPARPYLINWLYCPASQSDVSVFRNLLFVSAEGQTGRTDCGTQGVPEPVSKDRVRGIRIFDIRDPLRPKYVGNVQTCRGSHTHTVVTDKNDPDNVYVYISGSAGVRSPDELPGCSALAPDADPNSALFRIEVIKVPLADPSKAAIVSSPRIFTDLGPAPTRTTPPAPNAAPRGGAGAPGAAGAGAAGAGRGAGGGRGAAGDSAAAGRGGAGGRGAAGGAPRVRTGPNQCHDITVYPAVGLAGGACGGYGLLLDISNPANPRRIDAVADTNFSFWHSATFHNNGKAVLFTDEWGGGRAPRCRSSDKYEWGANALFTIENGKMVFQSYYKMPARQTEWENCVAHNGSPIPIPGREVMVQGWYQGGISIFDWTDPASPFELAFFDRGPLKDGELTSAGSWSVYWYNGVIVNSEIARGLDVFELTPSKYLSQNEIDAAKTVVFTELNPQEQPKMVWPASFAKARAFVDQLERSKGLSAARIGAVRGALTAAERASGAARKTALTRLATQVDADGKASSDKAKVAMLGDAVRELAQ
ncbi:MAG: hypothetical protein IPG05_16065 [Gemmatimonadetes bacterium]|nr:hypothetical protein [Gemmatimonadota bacterium]